MFFVLNQFLQLVTIYFEFASYNLLGMAYFYNEQSFVYSIITNHPFSFCKITSWWNFSRGHFNRYKNKIKMHLRGFKGNGFFLNQLSIKFNVCNIFKGDVFLRILTCQTYVISGWCQCKLSWKCPRIPVTWTMGFRKRAWYEVPKR